MLPCEFPKFCEQLLVAYLVDILDGEYPRRNEKKIVTLSLWILEILDCCILLHWTLNIVTFERKTHVLPANTFSSKKLLNYYYYCVLTQEIPLGYPRTFINFS